MAIPHVSAKTNTAPLSNAQDYLPVLPLLYVAWADAELTNIELAQIQQHLKHQDWIKPSAREQIMAWLDPASPPTAQTLKQWLNTLKAAAADLSTDERMSLAELGAQIAGDDQRAEVKVALEDVENALGVVSHEALRSVMAEVTPPHAEIEHREAPRFDVTKMQQHLDGDLAHLKQEIRDLLVSDPIFQKDEYISHSDFRQITLDRTKVLAQHKLGAMDIPEEFGGRGEPKGPLALMEILSHYDMSLVIKQGVHFGLFGGAVYLLGTDKHHQQYLSGLVDLDYCACFAMTELGHGSNVRELETTATFDPATQEFVINTPSESARKEYIGAAAQHATMAVVFAQAHVGGDCHGVNAFLVPIRNEKMHPMPGVRIEDNGMKMGLNGVDNGRLWFDNVRIPRENMLDRYASVTPEGEYVTDIASESKRFFTMIGALVKGRFGVAISALGASKTALTVATRYANRRRQFGPAGKPEALLMEYGTHQTRLMPRIAKAYAIDFALKQMTDKSLASGGESTREIETLAAAIKAYTTWYNTDTIQTARETCGGQGFLAVNRFADLKGDSDVYATFEGDNTVLMQLVAKGLLSEYGSQFNDNRMYAMMRMISRQASREITEKNPVVTRMRSEAHLRDADFHLNALRFREEVALVETAKRFRRQIKEKKLDSFVALTRVQGDMLELGNAYIERVILEEFLEYIDGVEDPDIAAMLRDLATLFALDSIKTNAAWYLERGYLSGTKYHALRRQVDKLCGQLKWQGIYLVDAFGIPDEILGAPIAT